MYYMFTKLVVSNALDHHSRVGGESLAVAQNLYTVSLFRGKELYVVFALHLSMARGGSIMNHYSMIPIYNWVSDNHDSNKVLGVTLMYGNDSTVLT